MGYFYFSESIQQNQMKVQAKHTHSKTPETIALTLSFEIHGKINRVPICCDGEKRSHIDG